MGALKLTYYQRERALEKSSFFVVGGVEKSALEEKKGIDYYSFGSPLPGRQFNTPGYDYGHGGQLADDEITGSRTHYSAEYWEYDSRLGRRWNVDPITYPFQSSYATFNNNPVVFNDPKGLWGKNKAKRKQKRAAKKAKRKGTDGPGEVYQSGTGDKDWGFGHDDGTGTGTRAHSFGFWNQGKGKLVKEAASKVVTITVEVMSEAEKVARLENISVFGSPDEFSRVILDSRVLSQKAKSDYFSLRVRTGSVRFREDPVGNMFMTFLEFGMFGVGSFGSTSLNSGFSRAIPKLQLFSETTVAANAGANLFINGVKLTKQLASEAQMAEKGIVLARSGKLRVAGRLANQYGGNPADWVKKGSSSFSKYGTTFETHWYENIVTGMRTEFKIKFPKNKL